MTERPVFGPVLGKLLTDRLIALAGSGDAIEAYGKAALCGTDCEMEHCSALIHTLRFGNFFREAVAAKTYLGFTNTRGPANTQIQVPLMDKHDAGRRSHYLTCSSRSRTPPAMTNWSSPWAPQPGQAAPPDRRPLCRSARNGA